MCACSGPARCRDRPELMLGQAQEPRVDEDHGPVVELLRMSTRANSASGATAWQASKGSTAWQSRSLLSRAPARGR